MAKTYARRPRRAPSDTKYVFKDEASTATRSRPTRVSKNRTVSARSGEHLLQTRIHATNVQRIYPTSFAVCNVSGRRLTAPSPVSGKQDLPDLTFTTMDFLSRSISRCGLVIPNGHTTSELQRALPFSTLQSTEKGPDEKFDEFYMTNSYAHTSGQRDTECSANRLLLQHRATTSALHKVKQPQSSITTMPSNSLLQDFTQGRKKLQIFHAESLDASNLGPHWSPSPLYRYPNPEITHSNEHLERQAGELCSSQQQARIDCVEPYTPASRAFEQFTRNALIGQEPGFWRERRQNARVDQSSSFRLSRYFPVSSHESNFNPACCLSDRLLQPLHAGLPFATNVTSIAEDPQGYRNSHEAVHDEDELCVQSGIAGAISSHPEYNYNRWRRGDHVLYQSCPGSEASPRRHSKIDEYIPCWHNECGSTINQISHHEREDNLVGSLPIITDEFDLDLYLTAQMDTADHTLPDWMTDAQPSKPLSSV